MRKKVLYSMAALSALPGAVNATDTNVGANNTVTVQNEAGQTIALANSVYTSTDGGKLTINIASSLMPGKYLLKATADNGESNNTLTVKYSVGGTETESNVADLGSGIDINVAKASKSAIVLTVEDATEGEKAAFTVGSITLELTFDFNAVYENLIGKFNTAFTSEVLAYSVLTEGNYAYNTELASQVAALKQIALEYADNEPGGTKGSQNYSTYNTKKLYSIYSNGDYTYTSLNNLALVTDFQNDVKELLGEVKVAENAARSAAALKGYDVLWDKLKKKYDNTTEPATGDEGVDEDGTLVQQINTVPAEAYGKEDLTTNDIYGLTKIHDAVKTMKAEIDALDAAFDENNEVQDYSGKGFTNFSTDDLEAQLAKVTQNYQGEDGNGGYKADKAAYDAIADDIANLKDKYNGLTAGEDLTPAQLNTLKAQLKEITKVEEGDNNGAYETYEEELNTNNLGYKYFDGSASHTVPITTEEEDGNSISKMIKDLDQAIDNATSAFNNVMKTVTAKVNELKAKLTAAENNVKALAAVTDGDETVYEASKYYTTTAISDAIEAIATNAAASDDVSVYVASEDYTNAVEAIYKETTEEEVTTVTGRIADYEEAAKAALAKFNVQWAKYTELKAEYDNARMNIISDYDTEYDEIGSRVAGVKATLTAVTNKSDAEHTTAVDGLDVTTTVNNISDDIDELIAMSDNAKAAAKALADRVAAKEKVDGLINSIGALTNDNQLQKLVDAFGEGEDPQGVTAGSAVGQRLKDAKEKWEGIYKNLKEQYDAAAAMGDEAATLAYNALFEKDGDENDLNEVFNALFTTTFEDYADADNSGLIYALEQHKQGVAANNESKTTAYNALGYTEAGENDTWTPTIEGSLAKLLSDNTTTAKNNVTAAAYNAETNVSGLTEAEIQTANGNGGDEDGVIATTIAAIKEKVDALKALIDADFAEEKLGTTWTTDYVKDGETVKAYSTQVEELQAEANDVITNTNSWIADTKNLNELTTLKTKVAGNANTSAETGIPAILPDVETVADAAKAHYLGVLNAEETGLMAQIAAVTIPEVPGTIITAGAARVLTDDGTFATLQTSLNKLNDDITTNENNARTNKAQYGAIYSNVKDENVEGSTDSHYNLTKKALDKLNTDLLTLEDTEAKTELKNTYNAQVTKLDEAKASILTHYAAGNYEEGASSTAYAEDDALLTTIDNTIVQARQTFNRDYNKDIVDKNDAAKTEMNRLLAATQTQVRAAQEVKAAYEAMGTKVNEVATALGNYDLDDVNSMLTISSDIANHVSALNAANTLYQQDQTDWDADKAAIDAIATNLAGFYEKIAACNTALTTKWTGIKASDEDLAEAKAAVNAEAFPDNTDENVNTKMIAAEALLTAGNKASTELTDAVGALVEETPVAKQPEVVADIQAKAKALTDAIVDYNAEDGYNALIDEAKNLAAKSDITNKATTWRKNNVQDIIDGINNGSYIDEEENILAEPFNLTSERKEALVEKVNTAATADGSIDQLDAAIEETADEDFYTAYTTEATGLKAKYDALAIDLSAIPTQVEEWKDADANYAETQAKIDEYAILTSDGELDTEDNTAILNKKYNDDLALVAGSKVENNETVTTAFAALKQNIKSFATATYADPAAVTLAYESGSWNSAYDAALTAEQAAIAADKDDLNTLFDEYKNLTSISFEKIAEMQANINAIDATSDDFETLKRYEPLIAQYTNTMETALGANAATTLANFQSAAAALAIDAEVVTFAEYEFGNDTYGQNIVSATTAIATEYADLKAAIEDIQGKLGNGETAGTKYNAENILYYQDEVSGIIGDEDSGLTKRIADLTAAVTETENNTLGMTPKAALADYEARKAANETAYSTISEALTAVQGELATAHEEYSTITADLNAFNDLDTDYAGLNLVEKNAESGEYEAKASYSTTEISADIATALQTNRRADLTTLAETTLKLNTIRTQVENAIAEKGLIGLAKSNLLAEADELAVEYTTLKEQIDADTELTKDKWKDDLNTLGDKVTALLEKVKDYKQPGDIANGGDGSVGADDFTALKNIILNGTTIDETTTPSLAQCDLNGDGKVGIGDLVILNNIQLGLNPDGSAAARSLGNKRESVTAEMTSTGATTRRLAVNLNNLEEYVAFQMDVVLPEGMTIVGESLTERARTQKLASSDLENGAHRIITVPLLNTTFKDNEGAVLYIDVETDQNYRGEDIRLENVIFASRAGIESKFNVNGSETTGIVDALKSAADSAKDAIYDLGGKVKNGLKKGINIIRRADGSTEKVIKK